MSEMIQARGTVHGQTISLEHPISLSEGEVVDLTITRCNQPVAAEYPPGERLRLSAGAWADIPEEVDEFNRWYRAERHRGYEHLYPPE